MNNLVLRTLTAAVYAAAMVAGILLNPLVCGALFLVVMAVAMEEFFRMSLGGRFIIQQKFALLTGAALFTAVLCIRTYGADPRWLSLSIVPFLAILVASFFNRDHSDFGSVCYVLAALLVIALPVCSVPFLIYGSSGEFDGHILLSVFVSIWACDVGAYCVGSTLGQRPGALKLAPNISPKKSWWGVAGGLFLGTAAAYGMHRLGWLPYPVVHCLALGFLISASSICGDLSESMWKRYFGVKDSGKCIPGHGGMYDRFDSALFAMPATLLYLAISGLL